MFFSVLSIMIMQVMLVRMIPVVLSLPQKRYDDCYASPTRAQRKGCRCRIDSEPDINL